MLSKGRKFLLDWVIGPVLHWYYFSFKGLPFNKNSKKCLIFIHIYLVSSARHSFSKSLFSFVIIFLPQPRPVYYKPIKDILHFAFVFLISSIFVILMVSISLLTSLICSCMLPTVSISTLSMLIIVISSSWCDNSSSLPRLVLILVLSLQTELLPFSLFGNFFLLVWPGLLGRRNCGR